MIYAGDVDRIPGFAACRTLAAASLDVARGFDGSRLIGPSAWHDLEQEGARALAELAVPETILHQCAGGVGPLAELGKVDGVSQFAIGARRGGLPAALARFLTDWRGGVCAMVERLNRDRSTLCAQLGIGPQACVTQIAQPGGEYHYGACVRKIIFSDGKTVAYKPRSVEREAHWSAFVDWLAAQGFADLSSAVALPKQGYGWAEWVVAGPVADSAGLERFYRRAGELLFWFWLTNGRDGVASNLVARGDMPVLIDCETCFYPGETAEFEPLSRTGLIPKAEVPAARARSGLAPVWPVRHHVRAVEVSTDESVHLARREESDRASCHVPILKGHHQPAPAWRGSILDGFQHAWTVAHDRREGLCAPNSPLRRNPGVGRFVVRPTRVYGEVLAGYLASGRSERWLDDILSDMAPPVGPFEERGRLVLSDHERDALSHFSFPKFPFCETASGVRLLDPDLPLPRWLSGGEIARRRLARLGDQSAQDALVAEIEMAFATDC